MLHVPRPSDGSSRPENRAALVGEVNFTIMYAAHDAFTRDLLRLTNACAAGRAWAADTAATWTMFKTQLQIHHRAEDVALWPQLRDTVHTRDALAVLDEMQAEHAHIDPAVDAVDAGFAARDESALFRALERLTASLATHTRHEENAALPLVEQHLGPAGWAVFTGHIRRIQGLRGGAEFFPWLLEDAPESSHDRVLQLVPPPVRLIYRLVWKPRYQRRLRALRRSEAMA